MNKLISSMKSLLSSHSAMMIFCMILMAGAFWGLSGGQLELYGLGSSAIFLPLAGFLVMCGAMALFMKHDKQGKERRVVRAQGELNTGSSKAKDETSFRRIWQ